MTLSGRAAIAGIGATDFSKNSGRSELRLAAEAVTDALDDAGLTPADVDGLVTFTMDSNLETAVARSTGIGELSFFSQIGYGGGAAAATVQQAALAVASGVAEVVVAYRAFNERSGVPVRPGDDRADRQRRLPRRRIQLVLSARAEHPGGLGRHDRPPLHARIRCDQRAISVRFRSPTANTRRPTRRRTSTASRSPSQSTRTHG
ncbi:MAG: hypothetical protein QM757_11300 [Paludibaculum sp.]